MDFSPFPYDGPEERHGPIMDALMRVVDPEVAMSIVDVGLVYGVRVDEHALHVRMTMTSAACPVTDVILEEAQQELERVAPPGMAVDVELVWEPFWTPERMSPRARRFMGW
jgi:metal-sulfur cluster biosynthetic enzyme